MESHTNGCVIVVIYSMLPDAFSNILSVVSSGGKKAISFQHFDLPNADTLYRTSDQTPYCSHF